MGKIKKTNIFALVFSVLIFSYTKVLSQNLTSHLENGLALKLQTSQFVYSPQDTIQASFVLQNQEYPSIRVRFSDSRVADFSIGKMGEQNLININQVALFIVIEKDIPQGSSYGGSVRINLSQYLQAIEGDTLVIQGQLRSKSFVVGIPSPVGGIQDYLTTANFSAVFNTSEGSPKYHPSYDLNSDGKINFLDWITWTSSITDNRTISDQTALTTRVFIREKTADLDRNGQIEQQDIDFFFKSFGSKIEEENYSYFADLTGDGLINFQDFIIFMRLFSKTE